MLFDPGGQDLATEVFKNMSTPPRTLIPPSEGYRGWSPDVLLGYSFFFADRYIKPYELTLSRNFLVTDHSYCSLGNIGALFTSRNEKRKTGPPIWGDLFGACPQCGNPAWRDPFDSGRCFHGLF